MRIGIIVAIADEVRVLIKQLGLPSWMEKKDGFGIRVFIISGHELYVVESGADEIKAVEYKKLIQTSAASSVKTLLTVLNKLNREEITND